MFNGEATAVMLLNGHDVPIKLPSKFYIDICIYIYLHSIVLLSAFVREASLVVVAVTAELESVKVQRGGD